MPIFHHFYIYEAHRTTGHNIELMDKHMPISEFDAIYLIDLCEPLLDIARKRFLKRGWTNVTVLCQDASEFTLPEWVNGKDPKGSVSWVTLSYSLSMASPILTSCLCPLIARHRTQIPSFYTVLDRIEHVLSPYVVHGSFHPLRLLIAAPDLTGCCRWLISIRPESSPLCMNGP